jgi:peptidoglycan/xylan/chitin deacetylase (PgdA/CDA1 family)
MTMEPATRPPRWLTATLFACALLLVSPLASWSAGPAGPAGSPGPTPRLARELAALLAWARDVGDRLIEAAEADRRMPPGPTPRATPRDPQTTPTDAPRPTAEPTDAPEPSPGRTPRPTPAPERQVSVLRHGPRTEQVIALTFDDGWGWRRCAKVVRTLDKAGVPATFFPNGMYVAAAPAFWGDVAQRYPFGNHTNHHLSLPGLSATRIRAEIADDERRIEAITGVPMIKVLRPPFGARDPRVDRVAASLGYHHVLLWDTRIGDSSRRSSERTMLRAALRGRPGSVVLMHCGNPRTVRLLPKVIAGYQARGFRFVTVPELLGIPWQAAAPLPTAAPSPAPAASPRVPR